MSARHNLFQPTEVVTLSSPDTVQIIRGTELVDMQIESTPNPISGATLPDTDDWIILRRIDSITFRMTIIVMPTDDAVIVYTRPFVTIYHYLSRRLSYYYQRSSQFSELSESLDWYTWRQAELQRLQQYFGQFKPIIDMLHR